MSSGRGTEVRSPGAERRRELRQQRRQERWRNLWRLLLLGSTAMGLGWLLLRQGWILRSPQQVEVVGSQQVGREQVIREAGLRFPVPLLSLEPQTLAEDLGSALPVERVQVSRLMLPPRLRIELVDRQAVARAERRGPQGLEQGYVDRLGNWMTSRQQLGRPQASAPLALVKGWQERWRPPLALVLARKDQLGSRLQEIRFEPNGSLWLVTEALGQVQLGPANERIGRQLDVLQHLSRQLPDRIRGLKVQSIDLSDPDQPELGLPFKGGAKGVGSKSSGVD